MASVLASTALRRNSALTLAVFVVSIERLKPSGVRGGRFGHMFGYLAHRPLVSSRSIPLLTGGEESHRKYLREASDSRRCLVEVLLRERRPIRGQRHGAAPPEVGDRACLSHTGLDLAKVIDQMIANAAHDLVRRPGAPERHLTGTVPTDPRLSPRQRLLSRLDDELVRLWFLGITPLNDTPGAARFVAAADQAHRSPLMRSAMRQDSGDP